MPLWCRFWLLALLLMPTLAWAQTQSINGNLVVVGHVNACTTGPSGGTDSYACTLGYPITAYQPKACYSFVADVANTAAASLNLHSLGAITIVKVQGGVTTALSDNDIRAGQIVQVCYDGTNMQMVSPLGNAPAGGVGNPSGTTSQAQYNNGGTFGGSSGLTLDGTTLTGLRQRVTPLSASATLTAADGPVIACTSGASDVTVTLPAAASTTQGHFRLIKVDAGAGGCVLAPNGSNTLNGVVGTQRADSAWSYVEAELVSPTGWSVTSGLLAATRSVFVPAGAMEVQGSCTLNPAAALVANGPKLTTVSCTDTNTDELDFDLVMPDGWNGGTLTLELVALSVGNNTNEVFAMNFSGQCVRSTDPVVAFAVLSGATATSPTNVAATLTWGNAAMLEQHATTAPLTLAGTCAGGAHVYLHGLVNATATTLTPMTDLKILGVKLEYGWTNTD